MCLAECPGGVNNNIDSRMTLLIDTYGYKLRGRGALKTSVSKNIVVFVETSPASSKCIFRCVSISSTGLWDVYNLLRFGASSQ